MNTLKPNIEFMQIPSSTKWKESLKTKQNRFWWIRFGAGNEILKGFLGGCKRLDKNLLTGIEKAMFILEGYKEDRETSSDIFIYHAGTSQPKSFYDPELKTNTKTKPIQKREFFNTDANNREVIIKPKAMTAPVKKKDKK